MKRLLAMLLVLILCFSVVGCSTDVPKKEQAEGGNETVTEKKEENFGLNETAVFKNLKFTATELKESNGDEFFKPENGKVFVGIKFTIENISEAEESLSSLLLFEGYVDDVKCDYSFSASVAFDEGTLDGSLAPGKKLVGWYPLEVPQNWQSIELEVKADWLSNSSAKFVFNK